MNSTIRAARRATALVLASAAAGCGAGEDFANKPRPPAPINVTAAITDGGISVSPARFGAGPIMLIVSNQSRSAQKVTLETNEIDGDGPGIRQTTRPIDPRGTATIQVDVRQGTYELRTADRAVQPVAIRVGAKRKSSQNELMQP
jgi:hypothetical protein